MMEQRKGLASFNLLVKQDESDLLFGASYENDFHLQKVVE